MPPTSFDGMRSVRKAHVPQIRDSEAGVEIDHGRVVLIAALSFDVPIDKRREVMSTVTAVARSIRWSTGCLGCRLVCDCEAPSVFTLICQWEGQAHLDRYLASAEFQILKGTRFLLREGPTLSIDEVVSRGRESAGRHIK